MQTFRIEKMAQGLPERLVPQAQQLPVEIVDGLPLQFLMQFQPGTVPVVEHPEIEVNLMFVAIQVQFQPIG